MAFADASTSRAWARNGERVKYDGPDHCGLSGAKALAKRLQDFWDAKGEPKRFEIYVVKRQRDGSHIYGVREKTDDRAAGPLKPVPLSRKTVNELTAITKRTLAGYPDIPFRAIFDTYQRGAELVAARKACWHAAALANICTSRYQLSKFFNVTHASLNRALAGTDAANASLGQKRVCTQRRRDVVAA